MDNYFHSVTLDNEKCRGCTKCIKNCPTEAIRVRKEKAHILNERCIDCGECIRTCPYHAKKAVADSLDKLRDFKFNIAIPAPSIYGQFDSKYSQVDILSAIKELGFDMVYDVARAAELVSQATVDYMNQNGSIRPLISSACPAVIRLIQVRFPSLIDNVIKLESPMEVSAGIARKKTTAFTDVSDSEVGVFFISPCPAKVTSIKAPNTQKRSLVDYAIPVSDIYLPVLRNLKHINSKSNDRVFCSGMEGITWAQSGGESSLLEDPQKIYVDGIHNVFSVLEKVEDDSLGDIRFIEALACTGGCLGGALTVENPFLARKRLTDQISRIPRKTYPISYSNWKEFIWTKDIEYKPVMKLDDNLSVAMEKLEKIEKIYNDLPGLDCGACGSPGCYAHAEDIIRGISKKSNCFHEMQNKIKKLENKVNKIKKSEKTR